MTHYATSSGRSRFRGLQHRRPAGAAPFIARNVSLRLVELDGAHARAARAGGAVRRSDHLRGLQAGTREVAATPLKSVLQCTIFEMSPKKSSMASSEITLEAVPSVGDMRRGVGRLRQSAADHVKRSRPAAAAAPAAL